MTEVEQVQVGVRWENNVNEEEDWEGAQNSAKLFERSRIKALAGMYLQQVINNEMFEKHYPL